MCDSIDDFRPRVVDLEDARDATARSLRIVDAKIAVEESRNDVCAADLEVFAPALGYPEETEGGEGESRAHCASAEAGVQARADKAAHLSKAAKDSDAIKVSSDQKA